MFWNAIFQVEIFLTIVTALSVPLGLYMARVFAHEPTFLDPVLAPVERTHLSHLPGAAGQRDDVGRIHGRDAALQHGRDDCAIRDAAGTGVPAAKSAEVRGGSA